MFLKVTRSGPRRYLQLVEAYRDADTGRPKQRHVATLGRLDRLAQGELDGLIDGLLKASGRAGLCDPVVVVDRQSGRTHYRPLLAEVFPTARLAVLDESPRRSVYRLEDGARRMVVRFEVDADAVHMPVSLASMIAKYTRELLMARRVSHA